MNALELPAAITPYVVAWVAVLGGCVGSFLNVVIARVPAGESIVRPGSRCPRCRTAIRWYDNLPVVSWLVLRGRCRACRTPISVRYPAVELLGAAAALVAWWRHGLAISALAELAFVAALLALAAIDLDTWLLPNALTWPLLALGLAAGAAGLTPAGGLRGAAYGAGIGFAAFAAVAWAGEKVFKKEAMGFGDVWLLADLGAWLGPMALLPVVLLASIQGSVVGLALILLGRGEPGPGAPLTPPGGEREEKHGGVVQEMATEEDWVPPRHAVPFGPFLVAGAVEWLWGAGLLSRLVPLLELFR